MKRFTINTHLQTVLILGAFLFAMPYWGNAQSSTEVDDLYFSKSDRVQIKYATDEEGNKVAQSQATYQAYSNDSYDPGYSAKNVNPEYIAKYKSASRESVQEQLNEQSQLDEQENPNYSNEDYYVEGYDKQRYSTDGSTVVNVYNGNGWNSMRPYNNFAFNSWNSPFWNPGWGFSIGYSWGWGGFGYGSPWGYYDPWFGSAWGSPWGFYDPWYGPSWGFNRWSRWNRPFYGYGGGWGYSNWAYNTGFYDGYYVGKSVGLDARHVVRGGRVNRSAVAGNTYASNGVSTRYRNANAVNVTGSRDTGGATRGRTVSSSTSARDYSGTQNEYFQRSRMGYSSGVGTNDRNTRAVTSRTSAREEYQNTARTRSSYSPSETTRSRNSTLENRTEAGNSRSINSQRSSGSEFRGVNPDNSRRLNTPPARQLVRPDYNDTNRSRSGYSTPPARETYSPPSRSRSNNTYSTPSYRNNGSGSRSTPSYSAPSRSSSPGRSSSPSYSAPSRSGGSFSAPSPSRSSGSSSGSRSSGSSSGSSRRGGN